MTASTIPMPRLPSAAVAAAAVWFGLALLAGATGFLARLPFPGPQLIILTLVVATFAAGTLVPALRDWVGRLPIRALIGINAFRFIGAWFLVIAARGELAPVFANRAGWGDIATAALALVLVAAGEPPTAPHPALAHAWNAFGLLDLVVAVGTATWVTLHAVTPGVQPVLTLPLVVLPTFFWQIFLANHVFIFRRLLAAGRGSDGRRDAARTRLRLRQPAPRLPRGDASLRGCAQAHRTPGHAVHLAAGARAHGHEPTVGLGRAARARPHDAEPHPPPPRPRGLDPRGRWARPPRGALDAHAGGTPATRPRTARMGARPGSPPRPPPRRAVGASGGRSGGRRGGRPTRVA